MLVLHVVEAELCWLDMVYGRAEGVVGQTRHMFIVDYLHCMRHMMNVQTTCLPSPDREDATT